MLDVLLCQLFHAILRNNYEIVAPRHKGFGPGAETHNDSSSLIREQALKKQPDILLVLAAAFGLGVLLTLMLPISSGPTIAAPASPLQAGVIDLR